MFRLDYFYYCGGVFLLLGWFALFLWCFASVCLLGGCGWCVMFVCVYGCGWLYLCSYYFVWDA